MIPHITRAGDARGVMSYLLRTGQREPHEAPHLIAGSPEAVWFVRGRLLAPRDARWFAWFLDEPLLAFEQVVEVPKRDRAGEVVGRRDAHVWQCTLSLHPEEQLVEDGRWGELAERFVERLGFAADTDGRAQCRWVAIRHGRSAAGCDHVHVIVALVAENGSKPSVHNDYPRAQAACRALEREFGLRRVEGRAPPTAY
jgi:hypothetical protein